MSQARSDCRAMPAPNSSSRERKAELLAEILRESRVTVLCGAAGAGKSQFLRSCLVPWLNRSEANTRTTEVVVLFDSGNEAPFPALRDTTHQSLVLVFGRKSVGPLPKSCSFVDNLLAWQGWLGVKLLIIFDQFERYLLAPSERPGKAAFSEELLRAVNLPGLNVSFLLALRDEAEPQLACLAERIPALLDNRLRLTSLQRAPDEGADAEPAQSPTLPVEPAMAAASAQQIEAIRSNVIATEFINRPPPRRLVRHAGEW
jgi:hypothetical protein